jgi:hypothetical protein
MAKEKDLIRLEKEIKSKIIQIKNKKLTPAESGIGKLINMMKTFDEPLFDKLMNDNICYLSDTIKKCIR